MPLFPYGKSAGTFVHFFWKTPGGVGGGSPGGAGGHAIAVIVSDGQRFCRWITTGNVPVRSSADRANKLVENNPDAGILPVRGAGGGRNATGRWWRVAGEAMPLSRQAGLPALSGGRPCALRGLIYNQAPVAGRCSALVSPTANGFAVGSRPGSTRRRVPPIEQINSIDTDSGTGTLPVGSLGGAPSRRRHLPSQSKISWPKQSGKWKFRRLTGRQLSQ